ncbi:hypothetical protein ABGB17_06135 [Sphaerisporangium sp. B11E5]|uniref:hypothetical protein n=1 Tax=Sphaerisporangium sp. B11E5 TaxID=3153563 RepID=UPI00325F4750
MNIRIGLPAVVALAVLAIAAPAAAHPFGPPSTARISADGPEVTLTWLAAEDDWVALGQSLGAFEPPGAGEVSTTLTGEQKLQRSPAVRAYLLRHLEVTQQGHPCPATLHPLESLTTQGARLTYTCPHPVTTLTVTVGALTDLNENYRTMLTATTPATPSQTLFTATTPTQTLHFSPETAPSPVTTTALTTATTATALLGTLALLHLRHRRKTHT